MSDHSSAMVVRGRGAVSNHGGRFERHVTEAFDDGWTQDDPAASIATTVTLEAARTAITRNDSPDLSFDRTVNPYRGCEHGCVYCYARPNHAYAGLSPGLDFESRLFAKPNAAGLLAAELRAPGYQPATLVLGGVTDIYQPIERKLGITRQLLEVLRDFGHPVALVTKSALVLRDLDILAPMAARGLAKVAVSVTTLDRRLARAMEPRAATPGRRLETIRALSAAGVPVTAMVAPVIPALNDHEIEAILTAAAEAGARDAGHVLLRLPREVSPLFREWLETAFPGRAAHVMSLIRQARGGADYDARWGERLRGSGPYAATIAARFKAHARRVGLQSMRLPLDVTLFRPPPKSGDQLSLF
jgi:DNA repair photolyase